MPCFNQLQYQQMEALERESCGQNDYQDQQMDFRQFIKKIEINCQKTLMNRRNKLLFKKKLKQNWLIKSKIIPPSFPQFNQSNPSSIINTRHLSKPKTSCQNTKQPLVFDEKQKSSIRWTADAQIGQSKERNLCKTSYMPFRNVVSCDRIKSNWKLSFRKDELNILRYSKLSQNTSTESIDETTSANKQFKIHKLLKKYDQTQAQIHRLYKTNLCLLSSKQKFSPKRQRLKTAGQTSNYRSQCFM